MTEPDKDPRVSPLHLRDRLLATLTEFNTAESERAVEAVCNQMSGWLRAMADDWHEQTSTGLDPYGKAAALLVQGIADGIEAGAPPPQVAE